MVVKARKVEHNLPGQSEQIHYYDISIAQKYFQFPPYKKDFNPNIFSLTGESILLFWFCLRNKRFRQICSVVFNLLKKIKKSDQGIPEYLKNALIGLDSTFIKVGQFLSSRSDLLPKEYIEALSELQDSLPPVPFHEIKLLIEEELKQPIDKIFKSVSSESIASASIGQVHKAELLNGTEVVIKIQKLDLSKVFYQDLSILRCIASFTGRYFKIAKDREWVEIIDEIGKTLFEEIDFIQEGKNADKFRKNLKYEERICIPKIFWQYTTRKLITIEYVPGIKITDVESIKQNNLNPKEIVSILVNAYFKQFFEDGFYHADPHPGNIVVRNDGTIVFYDFGMVGRINKNVRKELVSVLASVVANDTDTLIASLKSLNLIKEDTDLMPLKRVIEEAAYKYYDGAKFDSLNLDNLEEDLQKLFKDKPMKLPSKFTYALRMTGTLEGVCRTLDPDFSLIDVAKPFLHNWIQEKAPISKWKYLANLFPQQSKLIEKIKVYYDVIKDLPQQVSTIENKSNLYQGPSHKIDIELIELKKENKSLKEDSKELDSQLKYAYGIIFLLCFVFVGMFLISTGNYINGTIGLTLLGLSLIGSIVLVLWSLFNK